MKVSFVLPAYNEAADIEGNVRKVHEFASSRYPDFEIIVVDDGSKDRTLEALRGMQPGMPRLIVDTNGRNMGPGAAFRKGFALATGDIIVSAESDLAYPITDSEKLISKLNEGYDIVVATPHLIEGSGHKNVPPHRLALSLMGTGIYTFFVGTRLSTYSGFFRAYRKGVVKSVQFKSDGFESQVEILWRANRMGYKIAEVPSVQDYRSDRQSKFNIPREMGRHLNFLFGTVIPGNVEYMLKKPDAPKAQGRKN